MGRASLEQTRRYIETVQAMLRGDLVVGRIERNKVKFLDPDLGLIMMTYPRFSAFGPKSRDLTAQLKAGWLNFGVANTEGTQLNAKFWRKQITMRLL